MYLQSLSRRWVWNSHGAEARMQRHFNIKKKNRKKKLTPPNWQNMEGGDWYSFLSHLISVEVSIATSSLPCPHLTAEKVLHRLRFLSLPPSSLFTIDSQVLPPVPCGLLPENRSGLLDSESPACQNPNYCNGALDTFAGGTAILFVIML